MLIEKKLKNFVCKSELATILEILEPHIKDIDSAIVALEKHYKNSAIYVLNLACMIEDDQEMQDILKQNGKTTGDITGCQEIMKEIGQEMDYALFNDFTVEGFYELLRHLIKTRLK